MLLSLGNVIGYTDIFFVHLPRYLEYQRNTENLNLIMIMCLFSPLLMTTYGFGITRLVNYKF